MIGHEGIQASKVASDIGVVPTRGIAGLRPRQLVVGKGGCEIWKGVEIEELIGEVTVARVVEQRVQVK